MHFGLVSYETVCYRPGKTRILLDIRKRRDFIVVYWYACMHICERYKKYKYVSHGKYSFTDVLSKCLTLIHGSQILANFNSVSFPNYRLNLFKGL